jgi:hypothetical protein
MLMRCKAIPSTITLVNTGCLIKNLSTTSDKSSFSGAHTSYATMPKPSTAHAFSPTLRFIVQNLLCGRIS